MRHKVRSRGGTLLLLIATVYGAFMHMFLALRWVIGERSGAIAFFNTFAEWMLFPGLLLLPWAWITRTRRALMWLVIPVMTFFVFYGAQYLDRRRKAAPTVPVLCVMTHNILADPHPLDDLIAVLRASKADVLAIQEVSREFEPLLVAGLSDLYPYIASHARRSRFAGQAVFSKFPIVEDHYWQYDWLPTPLGHQRVMIETSFSKVVIYNVHPTHPGMNGRWFDPSYRSREIADVLSRVATETYPVIMMGDFNMPDHSDDYRTITETMIDSFQEVGWGMGWTFRYHLPLPFLRLDYVFHSRHWVPLESDVVYKHGGSDHYPVWARLALRQAVSS